jgi:hypothetical protein
MTIISERPTSCPSDIQFSFHNFDEPTVQETSQVLSTVLRELGKIIDISKLDGVTISYDYDEALAGLDRGYSSTYKLIKTTEFGTGIAMTPAVIRNGEIKSHIVLHGGISEKLLRAEHEDWGFAFHTIAHECAHVETTAAYDRCFPNELLQKKLGSLREILRSKIIKACWDEYAACRIAASIGSDPLLGYEQTFVIALSQTDSKIRDFVRNFKVRDADQFVASIFGCYENLLKFSCYMIGALDGTSRDLDICRDAKNALSNHWFAPHFSNLQQTCQKLAENFNKWTSKDDFETIGDIAEQIITERVLVANWQPDGSYSILVHPQTT